ncbi:hypothetical protein SLEP1_g27768 [Rubroshorea leprosula]|uniref:Uncharacterized protein n=1 Tax=Rubroshorea leprosula TaxID=152421 RepID=A0AAV5K2V4_9ROSI|nr:hypothetical protein SLEP1_g27768 [Rubroshorea leprosula]
MPCPILLFFFPSPLQPKKTQAPRQPPLEKKTSEKLVFFSSFLVLEPRNLPPCGENPDLLCSSSSPPAAPALWGANCWGFWAVSFFSKFPPATSPTAAPVLAGEFCMFCLRCGYVINDPASGG